VRSYNVFSDGVFAKDDISQVPCRTRSVVKGGSQQQGTEQGDCTLPLESGRTTDMTMAPQLVTLMEKSPRLSSYTPTILLSPAAPVVSQAEPTRHSSASATTISHLAISCGQKLARSRADGRVCCPFIASLY
jgi:hypothetical protein